MGKPITLFADYDKKENQITNFCGLILKALYRENPKSFQKVISGFIDEDFNILPEFVQQAKGKKEKRDEKGNPGKDDSSIPNLIIEQASFSIRFETKLYDQFDDNQIINHIRGFPEVKYKILLLLSVFGKEETKASLLEKYSSTAKSSHVILAALSFEDMISTISEAEKSDSYKELLEEFQYYLDRNSCFPSWTNLLEVVNCASTIDEAYVENVYICPNTGGSYSHQRAKYFGAYKGKNVKYIQEIKAVFEVSPGLAEKNNFQVKSKEDIQSVNITQLFNNSDESKKLSLLNEAIDKFRKNCNNGRFLDLDSNGFLVFLLTPIDKNNEANFCKTSSGGLFGNKKYFRNIAKVLDARNAAELATTIREKKITWESDVVRFL